ncbi:MAG: hypothetical protein KAR56_03695 [Thermoplasmata archaeon]|nr:hypothetical protein [Thermoplasmata archaeon]
MSSKPPFLNIRLRAIAQATEMEERVEAAMLYVSGMEEVPATRIEGHFSNPLTIFEVELTKTRDVKKFLQILKDAGMLIILMKKIEMRLDENCVFHFRLDKQKAYAEELALADSKDIIDVSMKVAAYPARRDIAKEALLDWFVDF